jgi:hypothetical protein
VKISKAPDAVMLFSGGMMMDSASGKMRVPDNGGNVNLANWIWLPASPRPGISGRTNSPDQPG